MKREERVAAMEQRLNRAKTVLSDTDAILSKLEAELDEIDRLDSYYGSDDWFADVEAHERGELGGIPCGVLSEDSVYVVITERRELALRMLELAAKIFRGN